MNNKLKIVIALLVAAAAVAAFLIMKTRSGGDGNELLTEVSPRIGPVRITISSTGSVLPKNRLQIKPPVNGRIESILVSEGDEVKKGQTIGWLSSTERAALLDAAQGQGEEKLKYWQEVYKPIALVAPIDAKVIVATLQPGQAVTTADPVLVLSDRLIVRAQVDETDIGKIAEGQKASISLDAYPDTRIAAEVDHIYHESQTVNNVTVYLVDLIPEKVPPFFRSGMNASVDFVVEAREQALLVPLEAVNRDDRGSYVLTRDYNGETTTRQVTLGLADDKNVEIVSGLDEDDAVIVKSQKYILPKSGAEAKNPFMPSRRPGANRRGR